MSTDTVADFGLCREANSHEVSGKVAIKWTAPEAVRHNQFTPASDMWSFGVLLWEIYSFGRLPYLGISVNDVLAEVESGYRLPRPDACPAELYTIMQRAWQAVPRARPQFCGVLDQLQAIWRRPSPLQLPSAQLVSSPPTTTSASLSPIPKSPPNSSPAPLSGNFNHPLFTLSSGSIPMEKTIPLPAPPKTTASPFTCGSKSYTRVV
ncbi:unnamed protein product [Protopolystoma xenopodis]|uniref:Protein kinase domain-containing protein n=1 Tax=Protopolystoma xenopodis TaxID=117903 RepID=A0A3S5A520_9PLAT|nr:unnamed protein product [Protopolystoma xenopodis]